MERNNVSQKKALEMLKNADPKLIHKFITGKIKTDVAFSEELIAFIDEALNKKATPEQFVKLFLKGIKDIKATFKKSVNKRYGYIDYTPRSPLNLMVVKTLKEIRSLAPTTTLRVRGQLDILATLGRENIEHSTEAYDKMLESVVNDFREIFTKGDEADKEHLFEECMRFLTDYQAYTFETREIENFILENFEELYGQSIKDYVDGRIEYFTSKGSLSRDQKRELGEYVEVMLGILYREGASESQLMEFANPYWELSEVRQWFIWYFKETQQWDKGINLAQESITIDRNDSQQVSLYHSWLKDLYRLSGQTEKYKDMLLTIIKESDLAKIETYRELKSLFTPGEWEKYREKIFFEKRDNDWIRAQYLVEDNLLDRLAQLVLSPKTSYFIFNEYAPILPKTYHNRILSKYESHFGQNALKATSRKDYQYVLGSLRDAYKIPGGKELADRLTSRWLGTYSNRPAFIEEIRKFRSES